MRGRTPPMFRRREFGRVSRTSLEGQRVSPDGISKGDVRTGSSSEEFFVSERGESVSDVMYEVECGRSGAMARTPGDQEAMEGAVKAL
jgi:hypothetical protein